MKLTILPALALLAFTVVPHAQATTFSVIKVSASLPCVTQTVATFPTLIKVKLATKDVINIALDQDIKTPVPKNIILGFAGDFADFGKLNPNTAGSMQLVIFDLDTSTKLKTIATVSDTTVAENQIINKYSRVFSSTLTIQDTGGVNSFFTGGVLQVGGTAKRTPFGPPVQATLKITAPCTVVGTINGAFFKNGVNQSGGIITKGTLKASGKVVGTFTE